ncbi:hypothetical protein LEP1GSC188_1844 [Leptospira weilii serovar Topaz str. LT2116]|uniref:Uncharacterized protein n=1 Tax=Leptospira weilii serovar Topaz str. LT2116 TaxID=1088540 RepID=M3G1I8_9LEPT|nr:hypothetical protein LEP1GSC188_1844 [Leptospira weilii serovar Topaz str. LT2116]
MSIGKQIQSTDSSEFDPHSDRPLSTDSTTLKKRISLGFLFQTIKFKE